MYHFVFELACQYSRYTCFPFFIHEVQIKIKQSNTKAWDGTNKFCPVLSSFPWMQHLHLWLSPDMQETHLFFVCLSANMVLVGTCKWRLKCHLKRCFILRFKRFVPILCNYDRASIQRELPLDTTPHSIHLNFSFSFVLASPPPSLHLLSDGSITPCSPLLPLASLNHVLLTSCVTAGSENRSSVSSSSWKSVRSGGGWLAVSAMFASVLDADDS